MEYDSDMRCAAPSRLKRILALLVRAYGRPVWRRWGRAVPVLVETILSQNTSDKNSSAGFAQLRRRFPTWEALADAPTDAVARCIRVSGLSRIKAPRIQGILRGIRQERGTISLEFLRRRPPEEAMAYLRAFPGVGPKTASCVLLFSLGLPVFPVDTHIHRIAIRLGLVPPGATADDVQETLTPRLAPADRYAMHVLLITHGRRTCTARSPRCEWCDLVRLCPSAKNKVVK